MKIRDGGDKQDRRGHRTLWSWVREKYTVLFICVRLIVYRVTESCRFNLAPAALLVHEFYHN